MRIVVEKSRGPVMAVKVLKAKYLNDFVLRIHFDDYSERVVDFKPFLSKSIHPEIKKYFKESKFKKFDIVDGNINWSDYELVFPISDLYNGKIN